MKNIKKYKKYKNVQINQEKCTDTHTHTRSGAKGSAGGRVCVCVCVQFYDFFVHFLSVCTVLYVLCDLLHIFYSIFMNMFVFVSLFLVCIEEANA